MPEPLGRSPNGPHTNPLSLPFIELQSVDSTNNYARQLITEGLALHKTTVFAHEQCAGKGQRGQSWTSEKNANILMSLLLEAPPLALTGQFQLSAIVSLGVHDFFSKYAGDPTRIKWPNDLYWQDRKAGGILIENVITGRSEVQSPESGVQSQEPAYRTGRSVVGSQKHVENDNPMNPWRWAIIGIGININQVNFSQDLKNPVSLRQITGKNFDPVQLAKELILSIQKWYDELLQNGFENILNLYNQNLYKKDEAVKLKKENIVFEGRLDGVSKSGQLIVTHSIQEEFEFGQIEWLLA